MTDIPGTFLHGDMEQDIHMLLESSIAMLIVKREPSLYRKFIWINRQGPCRISNSGKHYMEPYRHAMGKVLWIRHFAVTQVEYVPTTTVYQDNKSTILSAENGKQSSSQRTRHSNIRYFFVTDKI